MENASKALIIAGAVLVAILIVSLGVMIFNNFSESASNMVDLDAETIKTFNSKLTSYIGSSIAGSQVNAMLQYCLSNNMKATQSGETYKYITVTIEDSSGSTLASLDSSSDKYTKVPTSGAYYTIEGTYDKNGLLTTITGTQN